MALIRGWRSKRGRETVTMGNNRDGESMRFPGPIN